MKKDCEITINELEAILAEAETPFQKAVHEINRMIAGCYGHNRGFYVCFDATDYPNLTKEDIEKLKEMYSKEFKVNEYPRDSDEKILELGINYNI